MKGVIKDDRVWREYFDSDYMSIHDLDGDLTVTIKEMRFETVKGEGGRADDCLVAVFTDPDLLPMIMNVTNSKTISKLYGTKKPVEWVGKAITLFVDPSVRMGKETVGGLRIREAIPKTQKPVLEAKRLPALIKAIQSGQFTADQAKAKFSLTVGQAEQINNAQAVHDAAQKQEA